MTQSRKIHPAEYARKRNLAPQLLYYYIKRDVLKVEKCECGCKVIDIEDADAALIKKGVIKDGN